MHTGKSEDGRWHTGPFELSSGTRVWWNFHNGTQVKGSCFEKWKGLPLTVVTHWKPNQMMPFIYGPLSDYVYGPWATTWESIPLAGPAYADGRRPYIKSRTLEARLPLIQNHQVAVTLRFCASSPALAKVSFLLGKSSLARPLLLAAWCDSDWIEVVLCRLPVPVFFFFFWY
jgi:hypothetical protein